MKPRALTVPILLDSSYTGSRDQPLPIQPTHIASWIAPASSPGAGPSRCIALACPDNTIWFTTSAEPRNPSSSRGQLPKISLPPSSGNGSHQDGSPLSPLRRPASAQRTASYAGRSRETGALGIPTPRNRAASSASSVASVSKRRVSAFSPPNPAPPQPVSSLSAATASFAPPSGSDHSGRSSLSERDELLEHLREQRGQDRRSEEGPTGLGLGIAGLGRRGLPNVHGKEENPDSGRGHVSGSMSPSSVRSDDSSHTLGNRLISRLRGEDVSERDRERAMRERIEEVEVDREMEREVRDQQKEKDDMKKVAAGEEMAAAKRTPGSGTLGGTTPVEEAEGHPSDVPPKPVTRVFLPRRSRGKIVSMCVVQELGILCILRDNGLLNTISLSNLIVTSTIDLEAPDTRKPVDSTTEATALRLAPFWKWRNIQIGRVSGSPVVVVDGLPWPCGLPSPNGEVTRVIMLRPDIHHELKVSAKLELPGEGHVGIITTDDTTHLVHFTSTVATSYPVLVSGPKKSTQPGTGTPHRSPSLRASSTVASPQTSSSTRIGGDAAVPASGSSSLRPPESGLRQNMSFNSMKEAFNEGVKKDGSLARFLVGKKGDAEAKRAGMDGDGGEGVNLGEGKDLERDGYRDWTTVKLGPGGLGAGLADGSVDIIRVDAQKLRILTSITNADPRAEQFRDVFILAVDLVLITSKDRAQIFALSAGATKAEMQASIPATIDTDCSTEDSSVLLLAHDSVQAVDAATTTPAQSPRIRVRFQPVDRALSRPDIVVPFGNGFFFSADARGNVARSTLGSYLRGELEPSKDGPESDRLESPVTCMRVVRAKIGPSYLAAGDEDGCVRIWDADTFGLQGSWTLFAWPVCGMALLDMPESGPLINCLICVSQAGTVGLISLTEMDQLFIIPAARSPLRRVFLCEKDIMLAYANGKARVWNTKTMEFRRSTGLDAAEDMLQTGKWTEVVFDRPGGHSSILHSQPGHHGSGSDTGRVAQLDVRQVGAWLHTSAQQDGSSPLQLLRDLLSVCLTFGLDDDIDAVCTQQLGIARPNSAVFSGWQKNDSQSFSYATGEQAWHISAEMTGLRQLVIVALLRPFLDSPDMERWAAQVIAFYTASLPATIVEPELDFFANFYLDPGTDVHQAARMLFSARLNRMTDQEIDAVVTAHQDDLPTAGDAKQQDTDDAVLALTLIGGMALHKYQCMSPSALKAVAESILSYLHRPDCPHTGLAIELTSKGFATWQTYVDASDLLRRLFYLATHNSPAAATGPSKGLVPDAQASGLQPQTIPAQARLAVLHIASAHPALFMSTLSMDILDAKSLEGRKSIMKLCVFLTRKKPQVLEHSLPKIAEAVVKSLDPNVGKMREEVWEAATVILNELVLAFSTIDFHSGTQRLAVGTHEGALIMYDLKSASRLYVIEPHHHPVSSVCFSPDGRRLITVSLEEGSVTVWKVGSSLSGFFNVGGPPRQGNEKGEPFKRIVFMRADDRPMESTTALSDIKIEWPGARQARVMIKETALTFET